MTESPSFRLTLHIFHPSIDASEIKDTIDLPEKYAQSVGRLRRTKSGKLLGGVYKATNVSFLLHEKPVAFSDKSVDLMIHESLKKTDLDYIERIVKTGGKCNFLLGIFAECNVMFEINFELMGLLASTGIDIKFDFYGG